MAETSLYVPVLKSKGGEYQALRLLRYSCLRSITPLIDIAPPAPKRTGKSKPTPFQTQMKHHAKQIAECWRYADLPILIDTHLMPNSGEALLLLSELLKNHHLVPTHGPKRPDSYAQSIVEIVKRNASRGFCYRIPRSDLYDDDLERQLDDIVARCSLTFSGLDLIIDLEGLAFELSNEKQMALLGRINSFPHLKELRSITISGGSFPVDLTGVPAGISTRKRHEWDLWQKLLAGQKLARQPRYSDYGIQNPTRSSASYLGKANIRYTTSNDWLVFRGADVIDQKSKSKNLPAEMKALCKLAVKSKDMCDADYSWADEYIHSCAGGVIPANDAAKWKAVGFNHHITYVVNQLRALS